MHPVRTCNPPPDPGGRPALLRLETEPGHGDRPPRLRVRGELDLASRDRFCTALAAAVAEVADRRDADRARALVLDLSALTFIDCRGAEEVRRAVRLAATRSVHLQVLPGPALDRLPGPGTGEPAAAPIPAGRPPDGTPSAYDHLEPLLVERTRLPAHDPRRSTLRAELIAGFLPVARHIARRYRHRGENLDDLEQVATVGLINAVDRFEPDRGSGFLSFAVPTITGELQRHHRDRTATIRVPRRIRQLQAEVARAAEELGRRGGTAPRPTEIAEHLDRTTSEVLEALAANHRTHCSSLDEPFPGEEAAGENPRFVGALGAEDADLGLIDDRESLAPALDALPERERRILLLRFFGNQTQSQIAASLGLSQMHVSRLLSATLTRLRTELTDARPG